MPTKNRYLTDAQLTIVGRRYGSDEVALEASEALARWRRDVAALAGYGYGQSALDGFAADLAQHETLRAATLGEAYADRQGLPRLCSAESLAEMSRVSATGTTGGSCLRRQAIPPGAMAANTRS